VADLTIPSPAAGLAPTLSRHVATKAYVDGPRPLLSSTRGGSYTLAAGDVGVEQVYNSAAAGTFTLPTDAAQAIPVGSTVPLRQSGAGRLTVAAASGVTLVSRASAVQLAGQHAVAEVRKIATDTWTLYGDITSGSGGSFTGGSGGLLTDRTAVSYNNGTKTSTYHIYAAGLDWSKRVGLLVYGDGSGEAGLANTASTYLMAGTNGLIAVAKRNNMILVTPRAPGNGCTDGDGVCWYLPSNDGTTRAQKTTWLDNLIKTQVLPLYNIDKTRVCISGFSSGAENTAGIYGPAFAASWMEDGLLLAISYGSSPAQYGITSTYTTAFKANVAAVWDVYADDETTAVADSLDGYNWYVTNGFATRVRNVRPGGQHDRPGEFGGLVDQYVIQHVATA
jgi:predicted RecA/RadA family phage recombinase